MGQLAHDAWALLPGRQVRKRTLAVGSAGAFVLVFSNAALALEPVNEWEGFFVGATVGAVDTDMGVRDEARRASDHRGARVATNDLTGTVGVHGGYNWQFDNFVLGLEADWWWTDAGRARLIEVTDQFKSSDTNQGGSFRARAGLAQDNAHIYVTGGVGYIDSDITLDDPPSDEIVQQQGFVTFVAGVGAEIKFSRNWSGRLEYLEHFLAEGEDVCGVCNGRPGVLGGMASIVRGGLSYHFGQQDAPEPRIAINGSDIWTGFYGGIHAGAADTRTGAQEEDDRILDAEGVAVFTNDLGFAGGLHAGYQRQVGSAVIGVEADYTFVDAESARSLDTGTGDSFLSSEINGFGSLRARLGVTAGNALVYVTGGGGYVDYELVAADLAGGVPNPAETVVLEDSFAVVAGAGAEVKVNSNLSARLEYLYYRFDEESAVCPTCIQPTNADGEIHFVRAGLTYNLNGNAPGVADIAAADWGGHYIGGHLGFVQSRTGIRDEGGSILGNTTEGVTVFQEAQMLSGGLHIGHNHQIGNAVFGIEADYSFTDAGETREISTGAATIFTRSEALRGFGSLRGRLGLATGNTLFYATAGLGIVDATMSLSNTSLTPEHVEFDTLFAVVAGAGTEIRLNERFSARAEYLYYAFAEDDRVCNFCRLPAFADGDLHILRAGISYHFQPNGFLNP